MLEQPQIDHLNFSRLLEARFSIPHPVITFLPLGNSAFSWVYRVESANGKAYFAKLFNKAPPECCWKIPYALNLLGVASVVSPLMSDTNQVIVSFNNFTLLVYPFIDGASARTIAMTPSQRELFGKTLRDIHIAALPQETLAPVPRELFNCPFTETVTNVDSQICSQAASSSFFRELSALWKAHRKEIVTLMEAYTALGLAASKLKSPFVLCHSDIHTDNILLDSTGLLHIIDWDSPICAPKERDLMFVSTETSTDPFFRGYGPVPVDPLIMAYYRVDWVVQELADYGSRILDDSTSVITREQSQKEIEELFFPGKVVEQAFEAIRIAREQSAMI